MYILYLCFVLLVVYFAYICTSFVPQGYLGTKFRSTGGDNLTTLNNLVHL